MNKKNKQFNVGTLVHFFEVHSKKFELIFTNLNLFLSKYFIKDSSVLILQLLDNL